MCVREGKTVSVKESARHREWCKHEKMNSESERKIEKNNRELKQRGLCERHSFVAECERKQEKKSETEEKKR